MSESTGKRVAVAGAKAAGATIALGIAVVAIGAAALLPLPTTAVTAPSVTVTPVPTAQLAVCPGAFLRLGTAEGENADVASAIGAPTLTYGSSGDALTPSEIAGDGTPTMLAAGDAPAAISGSQVQSLAEADISGFASTACETPSSDAWLVGGSTATGRTTLVTIANPSDVAATVALDIYAESGAVSAPGAAGIVIDPHTQRVLPLAGFAPEAASPVVHVTSTGGLVVSSLQESVQRGLESAGADIVGSSAKPATSVVIPGLVVTTPDDVEARIAADPTGNGDLITIVRLFIPGTDAGSATVSVIPESGADEGTSFPIDVGSRTVVDVPLEGIGEGTYSVSVESDQPIVAAVRSSAVASPAAADNSSDLTWIASPTAIVGATSFSVSSGPSSALHLANATSAGASVTLTAPDGSTSDVAVPPGQSASVAVSTGTWMLSTTEPVVATVGYSSTSQLATYSVEPRLPDADPIVIYP